VSSFTHLPLLSQPQATVLALWSLGMVLARSCTLTAVAVFLAGWLHRKEQTVWQQLRESVTTSRRNGAAPVRPSPWNRVLSRCYAEC
jgi:hypothetical protein